MKIYSFIKKSRDLKKPKTKRKFSIKRLFVWAFRLAAFSILALAITFAYFWYTLPSPEKLMSREVPESTKIFDRNGNLLYEVHGEYKRTLVKLDQINQDAKEATIAIEDKDFYKHGGVSFWAMGRTLVTDIIYRKSAGGSTITQQFIKNAVLTNEKRISRKLKEIFLAVQIDSKYTKDEILQLYLNEIPYGRNAYGIEAASQAYFGKTSKGITLAESAYLAALPQAPSFYNPSGANRKSLDSRKNTVLKAMKEQNYITEEEHTKALEEKVEFKQARTALIAPHFVLYVQDYLGDKYGEKTLEEGGLKVYTTLDSELQKLAEKVVKENVEKNGPKYDANNAGLVAIDPKTGQVLAMVGSKDYFGTSFPEGCTPGKNCQFEPNVNVAIADRQPGSSFKPFVYVTAFKKDQGFNPATMLVDVNTNFGTFNGKAYEPKNYNGQNYGPVSMRQALAGSLNIPAVKTLSLVGVENATQTARDLGITTPLQNCGLSLVLGGCEVKLLDHTAAYATLANLGKKNDKTSLLKVEDNSGNILEEWKQDEKEVIEPEAAYQLLSIMTDNNARSFVFGTNSPLNFGDRQVACKTGTTNNWHDGWTMCTTPSLSVGVWSGNNDGKLLKKNADGVFVAAPIANAFLKEALKNKPKEIFQRPEKIKDVVVDSVSGKLPTQFSLSTKSEIFADWSVPKELDTLHVGVKYDLLDGSLATELTPSDRTYIKVYTDLHSERRDNPNWEEPVVKWMSGKGKEKGYEYPPSGVTTIPPDGGANNGPSSFDLGITTPVDNTAIFQLPYTVNAETKSSNAIARMDLFIDGLAYESITSSPFTWSINKKLPDGQHTIVVKAVDTGGKTATSSVSVIYTLSNQIYISEPREGGTLEFPTKVYALSEQNFSQLSFYYQGSNGFAKTLGSGSWVENSGIYRYELNLDKAPSTSGQIKIYAKAVGSSATSNKITVTIP